jgi:3-oxoacyl-[acyl-carrier protein] reductase
VDETANRFGGIDILVNNAAIENAAIYQQEAERFPGAMPRRDMRRDLLTMPRDWWNRYMSVNMWSALFCSRAAVPYMKARGQGRIVNQASVVAYMPGGNGAYGVAKLGMIGISRALAVQLGEYNITVNVIAPGATVTPALRDVSEAGSTSRRPGEAVQSVFIPLGRQSTPDELAKLLVFIASDNSAYITGHVFVADGGMVMPF